MCTNTKTYWSKNHSYPEARKVRVLPVVRDDGDEALAVLGALLHRRHVALRHVHVEPDRLAHLCELTPQHLCQHDGEGIPLRVAQEEVPLAGRVDGASGGDGELRHTEGGRRS